MFEMMDGIVRPWEDILKLPPGVTSRQWTPEAIAWILEVPSDLLFDTFGAKVAKGVVGFILSLAPQWLLPMIIPSWSTRDTEDMQGIAKHLVAEGLDPTPAEMVKIAEAIGKLRQGLTFGNWDSIAQAFGAKPLPVVAEELKAVGVAITNALGLPTFGRPQPAPSAPAPPPTQPSYPRATVESPGFG